MNYVQQIVNIINAEQFLSVYKNEGYSALESRFYHDYLLELNSPNESHPDLYTSVGSGSQAIVVDAEQDIVPAIYPAWKIGKFEDLLIGLGKELGNEFNPRGGSFATYVYPIGIIIVDDGIHRHVVSELKHEHSIAINQIMDLTKVERFNNYEAEFDADTPVAFALFQLLIELSREYAHMNQIFPKSVLDRLS